MKTPVSRQLLFIAIVVCFVLLVSQLSTVVGKKPSSPTITIKASLSLPKTLRIPVIDVSAPIQHLGVTPKEEMEIPANANEVGWFKLGSRPGDKGSAVISGHFDGKNGEDGVFTNLHKLKKGDEMFIEDAEGKISRFIVRETRMYDPGYAEDIFTRNDNAHLNLVTCDGVWDGTKKSYTKRLVVFADIST